MAAAGGRSSVTGGGATAPVPGFLMVQGTERIESTAALVDRLGTPGLKRARPPRGTHTRAACVVQPGLLSASAAALGGAARVRHLRNCGAGLTARAFVRVFRFTVVEAYSESWGPCGSVAPLLRKFLLEVAPPHDALQVLVVRAPHRAHSPLLP
jgi:hypothetical protein